MKRDDSVGFYQITYDNGFTQKKELITAKDHDWYLELNQRKIEIQELISEHKKNKKNRKNKIPVDPKLIDELNDINKTLKKEFPYDFFVVGSPMYKGLVTGEIIIDKPAGNAGTYYMFAVEITRDEM